MSLTSGKSPRRLLDEDFPDVWQEVDLAILARWRFIKEQKCPGCGRPLSQHLHNPYLGREETPEDYQAYSMDCPAMLAVAEGQEVWRKENKSAIEAYTKGQGVDPGLGVYWLSQGFREAIPQAEAE